MPDSIDHFLQSTAALEAIARVEHERWAHWQGYLHGQCASAADGSLRIPADLVERWTRQIATPYEQLSDDERSSDREQALEYLNALGEAHRTAES